MKTRRARWWQELPDRSGLYDYVVIVRAPDDPERKPRPPKGTPRDVAPHISIAKIPPREWGEQIAAVLEDGIARTMNRLAVEMIDKTADVVAGSTFEDGLWGLVAKGRVEYTRRAPVLFRIRR